MSKPSLIRADAIEVRFQARTIFSNVSFSLHQGEILTIVGPNGSGKSTCIKAMIGAQPLSKGRIHRAESLRIGYVPQKLSIDASLPLSVERFLNLPTFVPKTKVAHTLQRLDIAPLQHAQISTLSGGQLQRVLLARALLTDPQVLVLDEPTQGLDQAGSAQFYHIIEAIRQDMNCAILMVSHELHVVMSTSDRVICLNGHICCEGTPQVVRSAPEYQKLFGRGTKGTMALYRHDHDHSHDPTQEHGSACSHHE